MPRLKHPCLLKISPILAQMANTELSLYLRISTRDMFQASETNKFTVHIPVNCPQFGMIPDHPNVPAVFRRNAGVVAQILWDFQAVV